MKKSCIIRLLRYALGMSLLLGANGTLFGQYALTHYVAPSPWSYFTNANEVVLSVPTGSATITVTRSDGSPIGTYTVNAGDPVSFRPTAPFNIAPHAINTVLNGQGMIFTGTAPFGVNIRNVASDVSGTSGCSNVKGNASLTSFGEQGLGITYRLGYYRSVYTGLSACVGGISAPVYSVLATQNNTVVTLNGAPLTTLQAGQSYLFQAAMGSLLQTSAPVVVNSGAWSDAPGGCADGVVDQVIPISIAETDYLIVRGSGTAGTANNLPEQSTIIATEPGTTVTLQKYGPTGVLLSTTSINLASGGSFYTFHHGDAMNAYSSTRLISDKPIVVYSGTAQGCEVDMSTVPPIGGCAGSTIIGTEKFRNFSSANLPYFGYVMLQNATAPVLLNGVNLETLTGIPRFQIGATGYYLIRFTNTNIGNPTDINITSTARMTAAIVQQGGGYSMSAFFSSFNETPAPPTTNSTTMNCGSATLMAEAGLAPYQWYLNGVLIPGETGQTYVAVTSGNYSVVGTRDCGQTAPSAPINILVNALPTITLGPDPMVCMGNTTATLIYTATTGSPNLYSIDWDAAAEAQGFTDVTDQLLPPGQIVVDIPSGASATTYNATIKVKNSVTGCESINQNLVSMLMIHPLPTLNIIQPAPICTPATLDLASVNLGASPAGGSAAFFTLQNYAEDNINAMTNTIVGSGGTYFVRYTLPTGCFVIGQINLTVYPLIPVSISTVSPICPGENAVFTLNGSAGDIVTYSIDGGITMSISLPGGTANITVVMPANPVTLDLFTFNNPATACSGSLAGTSATIILESTNAAGTGGNKSFCLEAAQSVDLYEVLTNEQVGGFWTPYAGNPPGGTFYSAAGVFNTTGVIAGTYVFTYTAPQAFACPSDQAVVMIHISDLKAHCQETGVIKN